MKKFGTLIASVCVLVVAFVMHCLVEFEVLDFNQKRNLWFIVFAAIGIGLVLLFRAVMVKNKNNIGLVSFILLACGVAVLFAQYDIGKAWVIVLLGIFVLGMIVLAVGLIAGSKRNDNTAKNAQPGYKTYAERKAEEANAPKEEEKPLPKLQTFEDVNRKNQ